VPSPVVYFQHHNGIVRKYFLIVSAEAISGVNCFHSLPPL